MIVFAQFEIGIDVEPVFRERFQLHIINIQPVILRRILETHFHLCGAGSRIEDIGICSELIGQQYFFVSDEKASPQPGSFIPLFPRLTS